MPMNPKFSVLIYLFGIKARLLDVWAMVHGPSVLKSLIILGVKLDKWLKLFTQSGPTISLLLTTSEIISPNFFSCLSIDFLDGY